MPIRIAPLAVRTVGYQLAPDLFVLLLDNDGRAIEDGNSSGKYWAVTKEQYEELK